MKLWLDVLVKRLGPGSGLRRLVRFIILADTKHRWIYLSFGISFLLLLFFFPAFVFRLMDLFDRFLEVLNVSS